MNHSAFLDSLALAWPPGDSADITVLAAVSGGPDSLALLRGLHAIHKPGPGRLVAAHYNHLRRGQDSADDEQLVRDVCGRLGVDCHVARAASGDFDHAPDGFEAAARAARYRYLEETAQRVGARFVVTAHTADDQAETILHRILRGTGLAGLAGIPRSRALSPLTTLLRPLLAIRRTQIIAYLAEIGQPYREDATNRDTSYTRNRLRHDLLPQLAGEYNPQVMEALLRLGSLAREAQQVVDDRVAELVAKAVRFETDGAVTIAKGELKPAPAYLVCELLSALWRGQGWPKQAMSYEKWRELAEMALAEQHSKRMFPGGICAVQQGDRLRLTR